MFYKNNGGIERLTANRQTEANLKHSSQVRLCMYGNITDRSIEGLHLDEI